MSVLYKALQKAQKENQDRSDTPAPAFDAERLAGSGAIRAVGRGGLNLRTVAGVVSLVLAVVIVAGFFLIDTAPPPPPPRPPVQVATPAPPAPALQPAAPPTSVSEAPEAATAPPTAALQPPPTPAPPVATPPSEAPAIVAAAPAPTETLIPPASAPPPPVAAAPPSVAEPTPTAAPAPAPAPAPSDAAPPVPPTPPPAAPAVASPPAPQQAPSAPQQLPSAPQPMPQIAADSPARMLQPPINIRRAEYDFSGVGNAVQVREVSQAAQDNVGAAYGALVRGDYDMALGFYDRALQQEPGSVMAQLGRGAALHKLGRLDEARAGYERVLKADPKNREALTNLTAILAERAPAEAVSRLLELERDHPQFSPLKAQIGLTYAKLGDLDQALGYLRQAVNLTPEAVLYRYNLALVLDRMGRREQAVAAYDQLLDTAAGGRLPAGLDLAQIENRVRFLRVQ
ncbi:MAG: tetratricopeptide repeat protein [Rhodospirillaceae bacterium]|nr:tetratricopeptide repeat protein [Rhodospirillaceae bacterium]